MGQKSTWCVEMALIDRDDDDVERVMRLLLLIRIAEAVQRVVFLLGAAGDRSAKRLGMCLLC